MKLEFSRQIFEISSNIKFHETPSSGSRVVPCGQTDVFDEANSRFSQFCGLAQDLISCIKEKRISFPLLTPADQCCTPGPRRDILMLRRQWTQGNVFELFPNETELDRRSNCENLRSVHYGHD